MRIKLQKLKIFQPIFSLNYLYSLIVILSIAILSALGMFLYKNFYQTITQSEQIIVLRQEVSPDTINTKKIESVLELLNKKNTTTENSDLQNIKIPFSSDATPRNTFGID
jgi:hypothetical protein